MPETRRRAAIFDLDGTLIPLPSSERRFFRELWSRGLIDGRRGALFGLFFLLWLPRYGRDVSRKNKAYLSGLPVADVEALGQRFAHKQLLPNVASSVLARLRAHQVAADTTLLLTGSPYFLAEPLGEALGFDTVIATRPAARGNVFSAFPPTLHPMAQDKPALADTFCRAHHLRLSDAAAYGDSRLDLPLLRRVADPVAVNPDDLLREAAQSAHWSVLDALDPTAPNQQRADAGGQQEQR